MSLFTKHSASRAPLLRSHPICRRDPSIAEIVCAFCGAPDMVIGGYHKSTFISCSDCGADGPIGVGIDKAVRLYRDRPKGVPT